MKSTQKSIDKFPILIDNIKRKIRDKITKELPKSTKEELNMYVFNRITVNINFFK